MNKTIEIVDSGILLARFIPAEVAWDEGLNFFSLESEFVQVGVWGYNKGKTLSPHKHNKLTRVVDYTQEVLFIRRGAIVVTVYNDKKETIAEHALTKGDIAILLSGGHGYLITEEGTQVLEVKNGPYAGVDADRTRF